jgi:hypothetical protein
VPISATILFAAKLDHLVLLGDKSCPRSNFIVLGRMKNFRYLPQLVIYLSDSDTATTKALLA